MGKRKFCKWLRSGVIEKNIKDTLNATLKALYDVCPLNTTNNALHDSLYDVLHNDSDFRKKSQAHILVLGWLEDEKLSSSSSSSCKLSKETVVFKKSKLCSANITYGNVNSYNNEIIVFKKSKLCSANITYGNVNSYNNEITRGNHVEVFAKKKNFDNEINKSNMDLPQEEIIRSEEINVKSESSKDNKVVEGHKSNEKREDYHEKKRKLDRENSETSQKKKDYMMRTLGK
ncbi:hypothetical protein C2G38_197970 [Gigaspora rosea]|uniref:Uncharacterized protein n=1 Tax=Gigaspora rosea TaxID=44941 RepID=A0A397UM63_9GLOM|nr:hypothetical protein C2G38_197970 [Gigaspora rosea]